MRIEEKIEMKEYLTKKLIFMSKIEKLRLTALVDLMGNNNGK